jgi:hypothetical protein
VSALAMHFSSSRQGMITETNLVALAMCGLMVDSPGKR